MSAPIAAFPYRTAHFQVPEGPRLAYQTIGDGKPVILANGLGGTFHTWRHLYGMLAQKYRVYSWDYRGLHDSEPPADPRRVHVVDHVDDFECLLDHWHIEQAVFVGWSMGVQVNFELYRRQPQRFLGIAVINGSAGRPFDTVIGAEFSKHLLPVLLREIERRGETVSSLARSVTGWPGFIRLLKQLGIVAQSLDETAFADLAREFGKLDFGLYAETLRLLGEHDAWDVLRRIKVPTTIIAGDKDAMTPVVAASRMARLIKDAALVVIPDCTHYAPVERPEVVNQAVERLLSRVGY